MIKIQYETKFDKEYQTQFLDEMQFLSCKDIRYTFVKRINNIVTWKYEKTEELFLALAEFYKKYKK